MSDEQKAEFIFKQVDWRAGKKRYTNAKAADFFHLSYNEKIDFMNDVVFPAYEAAGSPEPYTEGCDLFIFNIFNK